MPSAKSHIFELKSPHSCNDQKDYYSNLALTLQEAKDRIGKELTEWKEMVGNLEQNKGHSSRKESGNVDDEDEEEEPEE